jgi:hypothetical protein
MALRAADTSPRRHGTAERAARRYRAALDRLVRGEATHPDHTGRPVRITPAAVAREAGLSRNPLYATHRAILDEIAAAVERPTPTAESATTLARLEAEIGELKAAARRYAQEKRALATENLALLHRARLAEERLAARERENAQLRRSAARVVRI